MLRDVTCVCNILIVRLYILLRDLGLRVASLHSDPLDLSGVTGNYMSEDIEVVCAVHAALHHYSVRIA